MAASQIDEFIAEGRRATRENITKIREALARPGDVTASHMDRCP